MQANPPMRGSRNGVHRVLAGPPGRCRGAVLSCLFVAVQEPHACQGVRPTNALEMRPAQNGSRREWPGRKIA